MNRAACPRGRVAGFYKSIRLRLARVHWCQELGSIDLLVSKELSAKFLESI